MQTHKISHRNSTRLLRKQQIILGITFIAAPRRMRIVLYVNNTVLLRINSYTVTNLTDCTDY